MPAIYEDFRKILASLVLEHPDFNDAEAALFGDAPPGTAAAVTCELYSAYQGQEALAKVHALAGSGPTLRAGFHRHAHAVTLVQRHLAESHLTLCPHFFILLSGAPGMAYPAFI